MNDEIEFLPFVVVNRHAGQFVPLEVSVSFALHKTLKYFVFDDTARNYCDIVGYNWKNTYDY